MKSFSEFQNNSIISEASKNRNFYNRVFDSAKRQGSSDLEANTIASQAALETGYGKYPSGSFNYFGQKGTSGENTSSMRTREVVNGRSVMMREPFKNYDSLDASIKDRRKKWNYKTQGTTNVRDAVSRLQIPGGQPIPGTKEVSHGAYATDPKYVDSVSSIANQYGRTSSPLSTLPRSGKGFISKIKNMLGLGQNKQSRVSLPKPSVKGALNSPSPVRVLAKLKGKTGELNKSTGKFTKRNWSSTEGGRYKKYGGK